MHWTYTNFWSAAHWPLWCHLSSNSKENLKKLQMVQKGACRTLILITPNSLWNHKNVYLEGKGHCMFQIIRPSDRLIRFATAQKKVSSLRTTYDKKILTYLSPVSVNNPLDDNQSMKNSLTSNYVYSTMSRNYLGIIQHSGCTVCYWFWTWMW